MKYRIENNSTFAKAFKVFGGTHDVATGTTEIVDVEGELSDAFIETQAAKGCVIEPAPRNAKVGIVIVEPDIPVAEKAPDPKSDPKSDGSDAAKTDDSGTTPLTREQLEAEASKLELTFPAGLPDDALAKMVSDAQAAAAAKTEGGK